MDLTLVAFLGLVVGNIVRQWLPFIRVYMTEGAVTWDSIYTRRFIMSIGAAFGFALANISQMIIRTSGIWDTFLVNASLGVNVNWIIEELSKWEFRSAINSTEEKPSTTTPPKTT